MSILDDVAAAQGVKLTPKNRKAVARDHLAKPRPQRIAEQNGNGPGNRTENGEQRLAQPAREVVDDRAAGLAEQTVREAAERALSEPESPAVEVDLIERLRGLDRRDDFLQSILDQYDRKGDLSAKQWSALAKSLDRQAEWDAKRAADRENAEPIPWALYEGRQVIEGEIVSAKYKDTAYGTIPKMIVKDDRGFRVWGTMPENIESTVYGQGYNGLQTLTGRRVKLVASIDASDDDESFGFFKRPSKAVFVDEKAPAGQPSDSELAGATGSQGDPGWEIGH